MGRRSETRREIASPPARLGVNRLEPGTYPALVERIRGIARAAVPAGAVVAVVSRGDDDLIRLDGLVGWHFPQTPRGTYAGFHPGTSADAVRELAAVRERGAAYLLLPATEFWWLDHYEGFRSHLEDHHRLMLRTEDTCAIYSLLSERSAKRPAGDHGKSEARKPARAPRATTASAAELADQSRMTTGPAPPGALRHPRAGLTHRTPHRGSEAVGRPRVLFISHNHPSIRPGGAEVYALELYEAMRASGTWDPVLLARAGPSTGAVDRSESRLTPVGADPNQYFFRTDEGNYDWLLGTSRDKSMYLRDFREFLLAVRPDLVHFQHTLFLGYDLVRETRRTLPWVPIVYTLHEYLPICHRDGQMVRILGNEPCLDESPGRCHECFPDVTPEAFFGRKRFIQSQLAPVDAFLAPSRFLLERYVKWGIARHKLRFEDYGRPGPAGPIVRTRAGARFRDRFGFFGQLNPYKGVDVLLRAMDVIEVGSRQTGGDREGTSRAEPRPRLWIHGANLELQRGTFQNEIRALLEATRDTVTFVGRYQREEVGRLMEAIDWVVVPSIWWENSPLVIQEAFLHRRPVICSDIGGMAEKVTHGVNGLHFRAGDTMRLAETILRAAADPELWERLSGGIPEVYRIEDHVSSLVTFYEELLARRGARFVRGVDRPTHAAPIEGAHR